MCKFRMAALVAVTIAPVAGWSLAGNRGSGGAEGRQLDPVTGRDPRNYPPDPQVRFEHMRLELRFDDLTSRSFRGVETLRFRTSGRPLRRLRLDAVGLRIEAVTDPDGRPLSFRSDDESLTVRFEPELPAESPGGIQIRYECREPERGMRWTMPEEFPGRDPGVHTQGQTEFNRYWFVSHDYPNARFTSEMVVTVPAGYTVISNGRLIEHARQADGTERWHYHEARPHVSYLVSLVIGKYAVVREMWRDVPVEYYVPPDKVERAARTFGRTPQMMDVFSRLTGVAYPYEKYAQAACYGYGGGGMENVSATTLYETCLPDARGAIDQDVEGLIAHELAHQWFGDMVTCQSWAHTWLNEGFATFMQHVWTQHGDGPDDYAWEMYNEMRHVAGVDSPALAAGLVYHEYEYPFECFWRVNAYPYHKGACVLHMLRLAAGEELFWRAVRTYLERFAWRQAETDDLRKIFDELSGRSWERFFQQWIYRPGAPSLCVGYEWDDETREVRVTLEQKQEVTRERPAFAADVEVRLVWPAPASGPAAGTLRTESHVIRMDQRTAGLRVRCGSEPSQVVVDPEGAVLAQWDLRQPAAMLVRQAVEGPTTMSRLRAIRALQQKDSADVRAALGRIVRDEGIHWGVRSEAAMVLGDMQSDPARDILIDALSEGPGIRHPKVRRAAVEALGKYRHAKAAATLLRFARADESYRVEEAALAGLGRQAPTDEIIGLLLAKSQRPTEDDPTCRAAVEALAALGDERGIEPAMRLAALGQPYRTRPAGVRALGKLGRSEARRKEVREFLVGLLSDPNDRVIEAALAALGEMGDKEAIPALEAFAAGCARPERRAEAREAIDSIRKDTGETEVIRDLRERVRRLEEARERLEKKAATVAGDKAEP